MITRSGTERLKQGLIAVWSPVRRAGLFCAYQRWDSRRGDFFADDTTLSGRLSD